MPKKKKARVAEPEEPEEPRTIVCFGDSNTHGADSESDDRIPYASRWTTHLQAELGAGALVIPEGLNGRTTVIDDPQENPDFAGLGGEGMNGRRALLPCLHSHKPVSLVVLALGCNDMKRRHYCDPVDIAAGMAALIADVRKSGAGPDAGAPAIVVVSTPNVRETAKCRSWGFADCEGKAKGTIAAYKALAKEQKVGFVDLGAAHPTGSDGIHFPASAGPRIAKAVAVAVRKHVEDAL